jgi:hypothetical protein
MPKACHVYRSVVCLFPSPKPDECRAPFRGALAASDIAVPDDGDDGATGSGKAQMGNRRDRLVVAFLSRGMGESRSEDRSVS